MSQYGGGYDYPAGGYAPSAPPLPPVGQNPPPSGQQQYYHQHQPPPQQQYGYPPPSSSGTSSAYFPPTTHPEIVRSFLAVDRDRSGAIDEAELQAALAAGYQRFSIRTVRLLMFLFGNPNSPSRIGPVEFAALWNCLGQWRTIFERFDRDRSGEIDSAELRDALLSLGYAVPPSVIQVLISKYNDGRGGRGSLNFDSFIECGTIIKVMVSNWKQTPRAGIISDPYPAMWETESVIYWVANKFYLFMGGDEHFSPKGLTEKFKEKDHRYTGSATLTYDDFMLTVIPFIVP